MRSVTEGNALTLILVLPARYLAHLARAAWHKTLHIQHSCVFSLLRSVPEGASLPAGGWHLCVSVSVPPGGGQPLHTTVALVECAW